jgi:hypothetical protein
MSDTPTQRKPPPRLDRVLAAHQRRARIIAQLHAQAIATANDLAAQPKAIAASTVKDAGHGKYRYLDLPKEVRWHRVIQLKQW